MVCVVFVVVVVVVVDIVVVVVMGVVVIVALALFLSLARGLVRTAADEMARLATLVTLICGAAKRSFHLRLKLRR